MERLVGVRRGSTIEKLSFGAQIHQNPPHRALERRNLADFANPSPQAPAISLSDTPRNSTWWRWKADDQRLMKQKTKPKKIFFFVEKIYFEEKKSEIFLEKKSPISKKSLFQKL